MAVEKHENVPFKMSSCWKMFLKLEGFLEEMFRMRKMVCIFGNWKLARIQIFFPNYWLSDKILNTF